MCVQFRAKDRVNRTSGATRWLKWASPPLLLHQPVPGIYPHLVANGVSNTRFIGTWDICFIKSHHTNATGQGLHVQTVLRESLVAGYCGVLRGIVRLLRTGWVSHQ